MNPTSPPAANTPDSQSGYNRLLLLLAGLGGPLFGVDVGIISGARPYLEATSGLNAGQLSFIVAAVLLGGGFSKLFADWSPQNEWDWTEFQARAAFNEKRLQAMGVNYRPLAKSD